MSVYGVSHWLNSEKAVTQLSLRGKKTDTLWFTIFHELCHILKHSKKEIFVELTEKAITSKEEQESDSFATETLIPSTSLKNFIAQNKKLSGKIICDYTKEIGVAPGIVVGRLQYLKRLRYTAHNKLKYTYNWDIEKINQ